MAAIINGVLRTNTRVPSIPYFWKKPFSWAIHNGAMRGLIVEWPMVSLVALRPVVGTDVTTRSARTMSLSRFMRLSLSVALRNVYLPYSRVISSKKPDLSSSLMKRGSTKPSGLAFGNSGLVRANNCIIDLTTRT